MTHKRIHPEQYPEQLAQKEVRLSELLAPYYQQPLAVFPSPATHYRMRAEFRVWHEQDDLYYIMFDPDTKERIRIDEFIPGSELMNKLMPSLLAVIKDNPVLRRKLFQVDFLTTTSNQAVISMLYHRQLEDNWQEQATTLADQLKHATGASIVNIIGRAKKQKVSVGDEFVTETLTIHERDYYFEQVENSFTQPNAAINKAMVEWALAATESSNHDLLELYCGNGNFSLPMAQNFRKVLATEISKVSVASAQKNIELNKIDNVTMLRMSAEDFSAVMEGQKDSRRANEAQVSEFNCETVLVDPPRAGLDEGTLALVQRYQKIIYISCNPNTLVENIAALADTHRVTKAALFDQFPYTEHMEAGVVLERFN
ncbi:tRNA (uracil-5-)-methyltransferase [Pseudidiomarina planktonica]|uniref:tRNA/tmRNA (uracil-C(5))-methyltransferase n=1 Tax=Pseudidiomarina planktonica TaxID=1323738 RepID=A0A1Y6FWI6_9GAMM|nr:tRNA (uridine(54)-C5)-methyltransferase TrmA [Pseudidiomarina planktonica]RUO63800.1 tRNA (uridine(54)-C5)-methyltransferase TrmA [Pseudidiomarina planktonica]SMQ80136.1 tRNA (uracil-5-)-methyltransferase [Pseudidiomarina planktonica]